MADFSIGEVVTIDGKGQAEIINKIFRGFGTMYLVRLNDSEFEVELPAERIRLLENAQPVGENVERNKQRTSTGQSDGRFQFVSDQEVDQFNYEQTNRNTLIKTVKDLKILREYLNAVGEQREIQDIQPAELSGLLCRFIVGVRKKDGGDYEPNCLRGMLASYDRQLKRHGYPESLINGPSFGRLRETLAMKHKQLKGDGKGNLPNKSDPLTDADVDTLWASGQLGMSTPDSILQTLWFYNTVHFGLRSVQEHRDMCWGDISLMRDDKGDEYLTFTERQTKTRTGVNLRDVRAVKPKLWANKNNPDRCPIAIYKEYARRRPNGYSEPDSPFYIASTTQHLPSPNDTWFRRNPVGVNKLSSMMKRMVQRSGISTDKHLSNHSARKYMIQKLNDSNVPANQIMQISGHKNIASINNYSHINENQHKNISAILHSTSNTCNNPVTATCQQPIHVNSNSLNAASSSNFHVSGGFHSIFGAPIHGGNFQIHVHQNENKINPCSPKRKRVRLIESDSD